MERLFKYPAMERQDLNQSQLGSFKFTPVDNLHSLTLEARAFLERQLAERAARILGMKAAQNDANVNALSVRTRDEPGKQVNQPEPSTDVDFFNKHIKPDLAESRLRLGPAALRVAVEGAASPKKRDSFMTEGSDTTQHLKANETVFPHFRIPNMDPTATAFVPDGTHPPRSTPLQALPESATFSETLCLALMNEQQAHHATKVALNQQVQRCSELEEQIKRNMQQIVSLNITRNNLGAIIKHNASKHGSRAAGEASTDQDEDAEEAALKEFYRTHQKLCRKRDETTGKDSLKTQKKQEFDDVVATGVAHDAGPALAAKVDDAQLFNLELLKNPEFDDSPGSALRRTLRKHFSIDCGLKDKATPSTPAGKHSRGDRLIDISPESVEGGKQKDNCNMDVNKGSAGHKTLPSGDEEQTNVTASQYQPRLLTTANPVLELPAGFLAKYSRRPSENQEPVLRDQSNGANIHMDMPNIAGLRITDKEEESATLVDNGQSSSIAFQQLSNVDKSTTAATASAGVPFSQTTLPKARLTVHVGDDLFREPRWLIHKGNPIFHNEEEKWQALAENGIAWLQNSPFPIHPVRYLPEDAAGTSNAYRTVMIDGIPVGSSVQDVLEVVRGGSLESVQLLPPMGNATSFITARIVFNYENAAHAMVQRQEVKEGGHREATRFKINGVAVRTWMPTDPTYPRTAELEDAIFGPSRASRIILIGDISEPVYHMIPEKLAHLSATRAVIQYSWTHDGFASIEFTDIKTALKVMAEFSQDSDFHECDLQFDVDYTCAAYVKGEPLGL